MFDLTNAHLNDAPLECVLAHEFGHWIVAQETGNYPIGFELTGIEQRGDRLVVTKSGKVEFYHSCFPRWEHALIHVAGAVAENLFTDPTSTTTAIQLCLESDESHAVDLQQALDVIRALHSEHQSEDLLTSRRLLAALEEAQAILEPRMYNLCTEVAAFQDKVLKQGLSTLSVLWDPDLTARLCNRDRTWYIVE
jgi:hypothetical protein